MLMYTNTHAYFDSYICTIYIYVHHKYVPTDKPSAVNIRNPDDITNESIVVQWDAVDDIFPVTYNVTWYNGEWYYRNGYGEWNIIHCNWIDY